MLSSFNATLPLYLGFKYDNPDIRQGFMSGGAGYVLTKEAISRVVEIALNNNHSTNNGQARHNVTCAPGHLGPEDRNLGNRDQTYDICFICNFGMANRKLLGKTKRNSRRFKG